MGCQTLGEYHDIYLYQDIFLLADIFEQFRNVCLKNYDLDPAHYHTAPGLAWDAALKITRVKLRTLKDRDMHLFFEEGMRCGISMISNRYLKANNPYLPDFDPDLPTSYNIYLDANTVNSLSKTDTFRTGTKCPSYKESNTGNKQRQGPTVGVR